ncbi:MAG: cupin domain-containing protein [Chloroflexi bacterium]|nr:cupin domain-containing protein [Chloroflexota bacterium]MCL5107344.1 cupin domain-containing protein [Chloroflexota bacterium]
MFRKWSEGVAVEAVPGAVRRTLAVGEKTLLVEWQIRGGAEVPLHQHPHEQTGYLVSGAGDMTIGEETRRLQQGDAYVAPGGVPHGLVAVEDCRIVDVFAPVREDYK